MAVVATAAATLGVLLTAELIRQIPSVLASKKLKEDIKEGKKLKKEGMGAAERAKLAGETNALQASQNKAIINSIKQGANTPADLIQIERMALEQADKSKETTARHVQREDQRIKSQAAIDLAALKGQEASLEHQRNVGLANLAGDVVQIGGTSLMSKNEMGDRDPGTMAKTAVEQMQEKSNTAYENLGVSNTGLGAAPIGVGTDYGFTPSEVDYIQSMTMGGNVSRDEAVRIVISRRRNEVAALN